MDSPSRRHTAIPGRSRTAYYINYNAATRPQNYHGLNGFYRPQRLALNYNYALPIPQHDGLLGKATNGWSVSGVTIIQDWRPANTGRFTRRNGLRIHNLISAAFPRRIGLLE